MVIMESTINFLFHHQKLVATENFAVDQVADLLMVERMNSFLGNSVNHYFSMTLSINRRTKYNCKPRYNR